VQTDQHNAEVRHKLLARLKSVPPEWAETLIGTLLAAQGFEETVSTKTGVLCREPDLWP
jgi:hypothetical protein